MFVTCWSGYGLAREEPGEPKDLRRHLLRMNRRTGAIEWQVEVDPVPSEDAFGGRMATHGYASSTPVSDGERVYVFFGKAGVFAYDLAGKRLWRTDVGAGSSKWKTGSGSSPSVANGVLFVNASDESHSIRALPHVGRQKSSGSALRRRSTKPTPRHS